MAWSEILEKIAQFCLSDFVMYIAADPANNKQGDVRCSISMHL